MKNFILFFVFLAGTVMLINGCSKNTDTTITPGSGNQAPSSPSSPIPANNSTSVSGFITVTWNCSDPDAGDTIRYDVVYGGTTNPTTVIASNTLNKAADIGVAPAGTTVYWKVTAKDNHGNTTVGPVWKYSTAP